MCLENINTLNPLILDTSGLVCPYPIIATKKAVRKLTNEARLTIIATDPSFYIDLKVFLRQTKHQLLNSITEGKKFSFELQVRHN